MTDAQKVAIDAMRSAWPEEAVARMLRAEDGRLEAEAAYVAGYFHRLVVFPGPDSVEECVARLVTLLPADLVEQQRIPAVPPGLSLAPSLTSPAEREHWESEPPTCAYCGERVSVEGAAHNRCERMR